MKTRIFLTALILFTLSFFIYQIAWYAGYDYGTSGIQLPSWNVIAFFLVLVSILSIWATWNFELRRIERSKALSSKQEDSIEKKKRDRLDSVLHDLSDEDLLQLKKRLSSGMIDDELLEERIVGEDGELLRERH
jgi:hypothetical protein